MTPASWRGRFVVERNDNGGWDVVDYLEQLDPFTPAADPSCFLVEWPTRAAAEDYARYLRRLVRSGVPVNLASAP